MHNQTHEASPSFHRFPFYKQIFIVIEFILFVITKLFTNKLCCSSPLYNVRFFTFSWAWRLLSYDENFELL